ncbi:hypothetical protein Cni_G09702 [Canna indica]|uniref:Endonuclease/exonuclease/phosphatase domain-containing protein n=1 Tax=Canna indica TaxID=4628 RepID=A0AAQ3Q7Y1_9LILI|nr:hypothetical protein Cni_G09702 [Canna indica]
MHGDRHAVEELNAGETSWLRSADLPSSSSSSQRFSFFDAVCSLSSLSIHEQVVSLGFQYDASSGALEAALSDFKSGNELKCTRMTYIVNIYGPPRRAGRREFFSELESLLDSSSGNLIIGGDFNITRFVHERRNCSGFACDSAALSQLITDHDLLDLPIKGKDFTWSNNQHPLSLAKLDQILISSSTLLSLPSTLVIGEDRRLSDHNVLIFRATQPLHTRNRNFRLECYWLPKVGFRNIINSMWNEPPREESTATRWIRR